MHHFQEMTFNFAYNLNKKYSSRMRAVHFCTSYPPIPYPSWIPYSPGRDMGPEIPTAPNRMTDRRMRKHYLPATPVAGGSNYWALDSVAQNSTFSVRGQKRAMLLITQDRLHKDLFINDLLWSA